MRIVLVGPVYPYRGGIAHYTTMLYRALTDMGHNVLLISFKRQYPRWFFPGKSDRDPSRDALKVEGARFVLDLFSPLSWFRTIRAIARFQPDRLVLQWWTPYWAPIWQMIGLVNKLRLNIPLIYICHNVLPHEGRRLDAMIARTTLRWADAFVVHSPDQGQQLLSMLPDALVTVRSHPVYDMFVCSRVPAKSEARRRLGLSPATDLLVLLFFGIVRPYKGLDVLLKAMPLIKAELRNVVLLVAGEFWEDPEKYFALVQQSGLQNCVSIRDEYIPNEEVAIYFAAADLLVAPYVEVTGSGVVNMARGFGLPYVATWEESVENGFDVPHASVAPQDPYALAQAICVLSKSLPESASLKVRSATTSSWRELALVLISPDSLSSAS